MISIAQDIISTICYLVKCIIYTVNKFTKK
ncbi:delta-lysin family phenol-soluble modulin [Staphylococcus aureus]